MDAVCSACDQWGKIYALLRINRYTSGMPSLSSSCEHKPRCLLTQKGFTLIELSIVLVIIGLITGGILLGMDLIEAAKNRQQVSQLEQFNAAKNTFLIKYNGLPGDLPSPQNFGFWGGDNGIPSQDFKGNGNRVLEDKLGNAPAVESWGEGFAFFIQLSQAGLVEGHFRHVVDSYSYCTGVRDPQFPKIKSGTGGLFPTTLQGNLYWYLGLNFCSFGIDDGSLATLSSGGVMTPFQAYALDSKIDDGVPGRGIVTAVTSPAVGGLDNVDGNCVKSGASQYNFDKSTRECRLYVRAQ